MSVVWPLVVAAPLALALAIVFGAPARRVALTLTALAPLPAVLALLLPDRPAPADLDWLLLGSRLGLDETGAPFLLLTAVVFGTAGFYQRSYLDDDPRRVRYAVFHLLTLAGTLATVLALDVVTFYFGFALMSFAAYGLVVHAATREAIRAGRVYIGLVVAGEAALLMAFLLSVHASGGLAIEDVPAAVAASPHRDLIIGLLFAGFGIKVGALPLHVWLPLAHPVAPTPGSAILSGCLIKLGLLGWVRFLPLGEASLPGWGTMFVVVGLASAFIGVLIGLTERQPKVVLAYSSISQMGLINIAVGVGLTDASAWSVAAPAAAFYALHHGIAKASLFLGAGVAEARPRGVARVLVPVGLVVGALALAGGPLTTGAAGKQVVKDAVTAGPAGLAQWLEPALTVSALATTLLMARFLVTLHRTASGPHAEPSHHRRGMLVWWAVAAIAILGVAWVATATMRGLPDAPDVVAPRYVWEATWPVAVGVGLAVVAAWIVRVLRIRVPVIAPGDLLVALERGAEATHVEPPRVPEPSDPVASIGSRWYGIYAEDDQRRRLARLESRITRWEVATVVALALTAALVVLPMVLP